MLLPVSVPIVVSGIDLRHFGPDSRMIQCCVLMACHVFVFTTFEFGLYVCCCSIVVVDSNWDVIHCCTCALYLIGVSVVSWVWWSLMLSDEIDGVHLCRVGCYSLLIGMVFGVLVVNCH